MAKTFKQFINEIHEPLNEGIPNRAATSFIGGVAGGIAGGVLGGLGGAALEALGGIPGATEAGLTGGISVGGASGLRAGLISGIEDDAEMARHEYETAVIHGWGRDHLDRFYKKYKDLVDTHNSLVMFKKNRMKLDPMFHEPLNELHMVPETPEDKYQEHLRSTGEAYNMAMRKHDQTVKDYEEPLKAAGNHGETKTEHYIEKGHRGETRHFIKTIITDKSGRVVLHKITQKPMPMSRKEFMKFFDTRPRKFMESYHYYLNEEEEEETKKKRKRMRRRFFNPLTPKEIDAQTIDIKTIRRKRKEKSKEKRLKNKNEN